MRTICSINVIVLLLTFSKCARDGEDEQKNATPDNDLSNITSAERNKLVVDYYEKVTKEAAIQKAPQCDVKWQAKVFEEILAPSRGPYRKPSTYPPPLSPVSSPSRSDLGSSSPSGSDSGLSSLSRNDSVSSTSSISSQSSTASSYYGDEEPEIRKLIKLDLSPERAKETYRLTDKNAETAFITRYYGFVNLDYDQSQINKFVEEIEEKYKTDYKYTLYDGPNLLDSFDSWDLQDKSYFCDVYINYSFVLVKENITYNIDRATEIKTAKVIVRYRHELIQQYQDTVKIVLCPCLVKGMKSTTLGVLPVSYQRNAFNYDLNEYVYEPRVFLYNHIKKTEKWITARVKTLALIDRQRIQQEINKTRQKNKQKEQEEAENPDKKAPGRKKDKRVSFGSVRKFFSRQKKEDGA